MCGTFSNKLEDCSSASAYLGPYSYGSPVDSTSSSSSYSSTSNTPEPETFVSNEQKSIKMPITSVPVITKKQYQCHLCFKNFSRPSALQTHSYTHTAEKPFQCLSPGCGRRFSVVSNLRRHFKVHQKPTVSDKISSEDRLRYVRQLIKTSNAILAKQKEMYGDQQQKQREKNKLDDNINTYQNIHLYPTPIAYHKEEPGNKELQQQHHCQTPSTNRYHHYILLPAISNSNYDTMHVTNNMYAPLVNNTAFTNQNHLSGSEHQYQQQQPQQLPSSTETMIKLNAKASSPPVTHSLPQQVHGSQFSAYYSYVCDKSDAYNDSTMNYCP